MANLKQKRLIILCLLMTFILVVVSGCGTPVKDIDDTDVEGRIKVLIDPSGIDFSQVSEIFVQVKKGSLKESKKISDVTDLEVAFGDLETGQWSVVADLKDDEGYILWIGEGEVTVEGDSTSSITIDDFNAQVSGKVVDLASAPVADTNISLDGEVMDITDSNGVFNFDLPENGDYTLNIKGGDGDYPYNSEEEITVDSSSDPMCLGELVSHPVLGIGVVIESKTAAQGMSAGNKEELTVEMKEIDLETIKGRNKSPIGGRLSVDICSMPDDKIKNNPSLVLLVWEPVSGTSDYEIYFVTDGSEELVWGSSSVDPGVDPEFDSDEPAAYLDNDDELSGSLEQAGTYSFIIKADGNKIVQVPVSIGQVLDRYPEGINYNASTETLNWSDVDKADDYNVIVELIGA